MYKEIIRKSIISWIVFWLTLFWVAYAAHTINWIRNQTINTWDVIWKSWFQAVNDSLKAATICNSANLWRHNNIWMPCVYITTTKAERDNRCHSIYGWSAFNFRHYSPLPNSRQCRLDWWHWTHQSKTYSWPMKKYTFLNNGINIIY